LAGGYAPLYPHHEFGAPQLARVRDALRLVLAGHEPYPALVMDRWWNLLDANQAVATLVAGCDAHLLEPPVNVLRLSLHPDGMAPRIVNLHQWRGHLLAQLARRAELTADPVLHDLLEELTEYGHAHRDGTAGRTPSGVPGPSDVVLPLRLRH